jgi:hypothetical protein
MCRRLCLLAFFLALPAVTGFAESNDFSRLARISFLDGNVSFMHPNEVEWSAASINMPLQIADRIYTGADGRAEIEFDDGSVIRLAEKTDVEILSLKENLIQVRVLVGLSSLDLRSGIAFEINTPAAAFNALRKGSYRFDVAENGDSDAIVRKGLLEASNEKMSRQIESEQMIHVLVGDSATYTVSKYQARDGWDEWNDRRNADVAVRSSRAYVPATVNMGVSDLDRYGRWVTVADYGSAWVPSYVDASWSPYWSGRWCYRPFWGWTWVSYEPWGWLPYHYGRWYHHTSFGWCWLPGAAFEFNFWSPGLVRFYHGPDWVSWAPLGPGDYYNVRNYHYNNIYAYQLNQLQMMQHRAPNQLFNQTVPGAFRTVRTENFVQNGFGPSSRVGALSDIDQPWIRGRMVNDKLDIPPNARSYAPAPERAAVRPEHAGDRLPVVVRTQPMAQDPGARIIRANPAPATGRQLSNESMPANPGRRAPEAATPGRDTSNPGRVLPSAPAPGNDTLRNPARTSPNRGERVVAAPDSRNTDTRPREVPSVRRPEPSSAQPGVQPGRRPDVPSSAPSRQPLPSAPAVRQPERPSAAPRPEAKPAEPKPRPKDPGESLSFQGSSDAGGQATSWSARHPSYYSTQQGWVRSVPGTSRYDAIPAQPPTGRNQAQEQPNVSRSYAGQSQPSYSLGESSTGRSYAAPQAQRPAQSAYEPTPSRQDYGRAPQAWGNSGFAGRQYSSPDRGTYASPGGRIGSSSGQNSGRTIAPSYGGGGFSGGSRSWGSMGGGSGMSSRSGGGAPSGGRRR